MRRLALALALLAAACGDDSGVAVFPDGALDTIPDSIQRFDAPVGDPSGAWEAPGPLYACFGMNGGVDFADTIPEVTANACCFWDRSGLIFYTNGTTGTWTIESVGSRLVITQDPPCGDSCGPFYYTPMPAVSCQF